MKVWHLGVAAIVLLVVAGALHLATRGDDGTPVAPQADGPAAEEPAPASVASRPAAEEPPARRVRTPTSRGDAARERIARIPPERLRQLRPSRGAAPTVTPRAVAGPAVGDERLPEARAASAAEVDDDGAREEEEEGFVYAADRQGIVAAMTSLKPALGECYAAWLRSEPALAGKLVVAFTIATSPDDPDLATVTGVELVGSDLDHALVEGCALNATQGLAFDAPADGELVVRYPFVFRSDPDLRGAWSGRSASRRRGGRSAIRTSRGSAARGCATACPR